MIRIAFVTSVSSPQIKTGGSEESLKILIKELSTKEIKIILYSYPPEAINIHDLGLVSKKNTKVFSLELLAPPVTLLPRLLFDFYKIKKNKEVDLIHVYNVFPMSAAGIFKMFNKDINIIGTLNNYAGICPVASYVCNGNCNLIKRIKCLSKGRKYFYKIFAPFYAVAYPLLIYFMKKLDGYIAISESVKNIYKKNGYNESTIKVIPNFVENIENSEVGGCKKDNDNFIVLYVGALSEYKGVSKLIKAFALFVNENPKSYLMIIGDGAQKKCYYKLVEKYKIVNNVYFKGKIEHSLIWEYYSMADVFVHPCNWQEPFGRTILEAMSFNLPCIVSDAGAPPEIVGNAGLMFNKNDINSLFNCLIEIHKNEKLRHKLISNIHNRLKKYSHETIIPEFVNFYNIILRRR